MAQHWLHLWHVISFKVLFLLMDVPLCSFSSVFSVSGRAEGGAPCVPAASLQQVWVVWGAVLQSFPSAAVHCSACRDLKQCLTVTGGRDSLVL